MEMESIRSVLLACPLTPGDHDKEIQHFSERLAEIWSCALKPKKTGKQIQNYLSDLSIAASKLDRLLSSMPTEVHSALALGTNQTVELVQALFYIAHRHEDFKDFRWPVSKRGTKEDRKAICVTCCAAKAWHVLTGRRATPGMKNRAGDRSEFEQFLSKIFAALGLNASSEHYAKQLRSNHKKWRRLIEDDFRLLNVGDLLGQK